MDERGSHKTKDQEPHRIMFWSEKDPPSRFAGLTKGVPKEDVALAVALLRSGTPGQSYMGWADCRICELRLGTKDFSRFGFVWPEKAEHYIDEHGVWTPGIAAFVAQVKAAKSLKAAKGRP